MDQRSRFRGCLLGLAAGDAVGTTLEFMPRESITPIDDMIGGGPFLLKPGEWTDDTSMALCLAASLLEKRDFDAADQMDRYCRWRSSGYMSSNGICFDIGNTVSRALNTYQSSGNPFSGPTSPRSAGNGSLMRLAPVVLYYYPDSQLSLKHAAESSRTTHGAPECLDACRLFAAFLLRALSGASREGILSPISADFCSSSLNSIARLEFLGKNAAAIRGSGYVVHCLEAALWCFSQTDSFRSAILLAANLGEDADTTAAVCGQIAGAHYGELGIPSSWRSKLAMNEQIVSFADLLLGTVA